MSLSKTSFSLSHTYTSKTGWLAFLSPGSAGGTSFLKIETGRYDKEKPEERLCLWCSNAIEDEKHFLLECNLYRSIRQKTLKDLKLDATHPGRAELIRMMGGGKWKSSEEEVLTHHIVRTRKLRERFLELL